MGLADGVARVEVAGVPVAALRAEELIDRVVDHAAADAPPRFIAYANAATICLARDDPEYAAILRDRADLVYADGQSVVWAARLLGLRLPERVNAGDFWLDLLARLRDRNLSVYLLGGYPEDGLALAARLAEAVPGLAIAGLRDGFFSEEEAGRVAADIRDAVPAVLFVGMGAPRQERWAARHLDTLQVPVVWCVGALFEYYAGRRRRAPVWMRRTGLEWAWRLALEPGRLWRRYLIGNVRFTLLVLRQALFG